MCPTRKAGASARRSLPPACLSFDSHPMTSRPDLSAVARRFQLYGEFLSGEPYGSGHINDTYCLRFQQAGTPVRYLLQRINHHVFKDPPGLMENVQRVTSHINSKLLGEPDSSRRVLNL